MAEKQAPNCMHKASSLKLHAHTFYNRYTLPIVIIRETKAWVSTYKQGRNQTFDKDETKASEPGRRKQLGGIWCMPPRKL